MVNHEMRFDLEQKIIGCWNVVDDIKLLTATPTATTEDYQALARIYQIKFENLFNHYERMCALRCFDND